jgi:DnaJ family protein C protein 11
VFHPDKHLDEQRRKQAQESFSKVQEAYEVLAAPEKRQVYDVYGKQGLAAGASLCVRVRIYARQQ